MSARQESGLHSSKGLKYVNRSSTTRSRLPPKNKTRSSPAAASDMTTELYIDADGAGPSKPRASTAKAASYDRKHPPTKPHPSNPRSKIPTGPRASLVPKQDAKGKGREVVTDRPRRSPVRKATHQNYSLNESATSEDDEEMYIAPRQPSSSRMTIEDLPVQTPRNQRSTATTTSVATSSAIRDGKVRARTGSLAPMEVLSAMKPIPLKTVYLSSPPRLGRSSETESSSESEDEVRLIEPPSTSARKRKAAAGEYTWDERSRSCIPKRERSRSRSLAASVHRNRLDPTTPGANGQDSLASERSHLQDKAFPTSDNDLLKSLLTNRLRARAITEQSTPAKREQPGEYHDPFLDETNIDVQPLQDDMDMYLNIPDMQVDDLAAEQPTFNFSHTDLPDDDSDDDNFGASRGTAPSSDDGFERSVVHLDNLIEEEPDLPAVRIAPEDRPDEDIKIEVPEEDPPSHSHSLAQSPETKEGVPEDVVASTPTAVKLSEVQAVYSTVEGDEVQSSNSARHDLEPEREGLQCFQEPSLLIPKARAIRSSSVVSDLPPSSPPPLPSYGSESVISEDELEVEVQPTIPRIKILQQRSNSAGPLSPKSTNRHVRPSPSSRSASPKYSPRLGNTRKEYAADLVRKDGSPAAIAHIERRLVPISLCSEATSELVTKEGSPGMKLPGLLAPLRSPSPLAESTAMVDLRELPNDQLFSVRKSPRLPQFTPVRLRTASPATFEVYNTEETNALPISTPERNATHGSLSGQPLEPEAGIHLPKMESVSPLLASAATCENSPIPQISPRPPSTLKVPLLSAGKRYSSRSPDLSADTTAQEQQKPRITPEGYEDVAVHAVPAQSNSTRARSPVCHQPALLVPPSPFLPRSSRSPTPDRIAEKTAASLLERVRALRSPSVIRATRSRTPSLIMQSANLKGMEAEATEAVEQAPMNVLHASHGTLQADTGVAVHFPRASEPPVETSTHSQHASEETAAPALSQEEVSLGIPSTAFIRSLSTEGISGAGLADARSESDTEVDHDAGIHRGRASPHTPPAKSPALKHVLLPLDDPDLSPNVTLRRERSTSRSTASTKSTRSARITDKSPLRRPRRMSFADIGALDSSPISVAASIGRSSFDALDSSSDDDEAEVMEQLERNDEAEDKDIRTSPSKVIAEKQLRHGSMDIDELETSDEEDLSFSSSPARSVTNASESRVAPWIQDPPVTSTPARLMGTLDIQSSDASLQQLPPVAASTPNPRRQLATSPKPASSPQSAPRVALHAERGHVAADRCPSVLATLENGLEGQSGEKSGTVEQPTSLLVGRNDVVEIALDDNMLEVDHDLSTTRIAISPNTSATLDEARPRTSLIVPPLSNVARPSSARSTRSRRKGTIEPGPDLITKQSVSPEPTMSVISTQPSQKARSQSVVSRSESSVSRQDSLASQAANIVQVSSADPMAAARAAAILKVHHNYIQDGIWPTDINPLTRAASGSSEEGERALDDLLKQAEREVSVALQERSQSVPTYAGSSQEEQSMDVSTADRDNEPRERSMSASRHFIDQSKLDVWTRHDWRALEQCFIDELRRKRGSREPVEPAEVVRLYLESEQLRPEQCIGQWKPELLEVRVEALIARKQHKAPRVRERSQSIASTAYSRAPSDFFADEDAHIHSQQVNERAADTSYLDIPGALLSPGRRRYARSAEPVRVNTPSGQQDYARYREISKYQSLQRRLPAQSSLSRETSLSSVAEAEETQSVASEPPLSKFSRGISRLYPSLDDLKAEMKPKKFLPVRGRSVAAAVNLFEKIEEEQSIEVQWEQTWLKRKASENDLKKVDDIKKRVRI